MLCFLLLVYYLSSSTCSELLRRHRRNWIIDSYSIEEEHKGPFPYELGKIDIDRDYVIYFNLNGHGVDKEPKGVLSINSTSGTIWVHKAVDYEARPQLELKFQARRADSTIDTRLGVEISILDINDNPPRFDKDQFDISVPEDQAQGYLGMTMVASDKDKSGTPNSTFHYEIKSVSPKPADSEFFIEKTGSITFKGCLDHEASKKISIVIEVKDHGEVVSLSSSATVVIHVQDSNDHLPTISGQTGPDKVKEETKGSSPLRLHVTDQDTRNSPAWRARFTIHGDEGGHFKIETDPVTNDGILTVVKPLDFEKGAQRELSISVENEIPYFFCKVKERTSSGPWTVESSKGDHASAAQPHTVNVTIEVEDVNDPPKFRESVKKTVVKENAPTGTWLGNVTAVDKDSSHTNTFVYKVGHDPADWVTVDPHTGNITTVKRPDRESPFVVNGVYTVILHAVDNGEPPLTGTCTLQIYVIDQNDNAPQPEVQHFDVCMSNMSTTANITASDLDGDPFGGPFTFELLGDVKGKWKLRPSYGYTAGLVKEPGLYAGQHKIDLKITDMQGEFGVYNLSVTVCDCSLSANCRTQRKTAAKADFGAIGIVFASLLALLFVMLMAIICSHKKEFTVLEMESAGNTLLKSNTEKPGTDCKVTA
ncbi:cadherin-like protein 26 [Hippoglossus hippoglossus]|uniref:cadherin-like protein 26 n=1 Tax=Hippoglossus hippoglossus TaxID=8267 RepID=UPI00148B5A0D|nr:cadherin-like protein 26 [Hippoglossus hippoglossus]